MTKKTLKRKILIRKTLLNVLLKYFAPTNRYIIYLSQNLDKHISIYQYYIYKRNKKITRNIHIQKAA